MRMNRPGEAMTSTRNVAMCFLALLVLLALSVPAAAYVSLGKGNSGLLGGDLTDPEDKLAPPDKDSAGDLPEGDLIPKNATWVKMACWPANGPDRPAHQRHPYQSWQHSPACS